MMPSPANQETGGCLRGHFPRAERAKKNRKYFFTEDVAKPKETLSVRVKRFRRNQKGRKPV
jgi:hypothetical protein